MTETQAVKTQRPAMHPEVHRLGRYLLRARLDIPEKEKIYTVTQNIRRPNTHPLHLIEFRICKWHPRYHWKPDADSEVVGLEVL